MPGSRKALLLAGCLALGPHGPTRPPQPGHAASGAPTSRWKRVEGWPRLAPGLRLGEVSGVALDSHGHVLLFHRAGRSFEPTATQPITAPTVLELDAVTGALLHSWGAGMFLVPHSLTVDADDNVWLTDVGRQQVLEFSHDGAPVRTIGHRRAPGWDATHFDQPTDVFVCADGSFYVSDGYINARVARFDRTGAFVREWGHEGADPGEFHVPHGIAVGGLDRVYVADRENARLQVFDTTGTYLGEWPREGRPGRSAGRVFDVAVSESGRLYLAVKGGADLVVMLDRDLREVDHIPATAANVVTAHALAVQGDSVVYLADTGGRQLLKFVSR